MAANYRMIYLADRGDAACEGYTQQSRQSAQEHAAKIAEILMGPQTKGPPPRVSDLVRD